MFALRLLKNGARLTVTFQYDKHEFGIGHLLGFLAASRTRRGIDVRPTLRSRGKRGLPHFVGYPTIGNP
ncbi:hypothetical protein [Actibacterium pelagium]|uniref:Uncharacterized protein n=1 Tax=Actibacterium pelagium TaxID=2029103 RepID=A0A917ADU9_9RHOB|nr:hypothetical protein [Actibacterium pelagium]GGE45536.1 hypothetical protein GCM10011517_11430 [Actibacterium pelagium]